MNKNGFFKSILKEHKSGIIISLLIGLIFLLPHVLIPTLQPAETDYYPLVAKGVDARSVDELFYAWSVREVVDGHVIPRSTIFESKDVFRFPFVGAVVPAVLVAGLYYLFGTISWTFISSVVIFTFLSSLLFYFLIYILVRKKSLAMFGSTILFFSPTYILKFFTDKITQPPSYFSRFYAVLADFPIFVISLILIWQIIKKPKLWKAILSGIVGGMLFYTYFYYWTFYVVFISIVFVYYLIRKDYKISLKLFYSVLISLLVAVPFIYSIVGKGPTTQDLVSRHTSYLGHLPDVSATLFLSFFLLAIILVCYFKNKTFKELKNKLMEKQESFVIILLISSIIIMNVQVILGFTISPRHWLTTVIWPVIIIAALIVVSNINLKRLLNEKVFENIIKIVVLGLLIFGVIWQVTFALNMQDAYTLPESQIDLFDWLNDNTPNDAVALTLDSDLLLLLPVYTHTNNFIPSAVVDSVPISEIIKRRLIGHKLLGASPEDFAFLKDPCSGGRLIKDNFEDKKGGFYDYSLFESAFAYHLTFHSRNIPEDCQIPLDLREQIYGLYESLPSDFDTLLNFYQLDYIIVNLNSQELIDDSDSSAELSYKNNDYEIYRVNN